MNKEEAASPQEWNKYLKRTHATRLIMGFASMAVLTVMVVLIYCFDLDIVLSLVMMGCWAIVVPAAAFSMAAFARGCRLHTKWQWLFFSWGSILVFFMCMYLFVVHPPLSGGMTTLRYMEDNYDNSRIQFRNLTTYVDKNMDRETRLTAEWGKFGKLKMLETGTVENGTDRRYSPSSATVDSLLNNIGMSREQFETLTKLVSKCDCVGVEVNPDGVRLGYRRVGYGEYFYFLPNERPYVMEKDMMYDIVHYNDSVFFEYCGGDDGLQEFEPEVKNHYLKMNSASGTDRSEDEPDAE